MTSELSEWEKFKEYTHDYDTGYEHPSVYAKWIMAELEKYFKDQTRDDSDTMRYVFQPIIDHLKALGVPHDE